MVNKKKRSAKVEEVRCYVEGVAKNVIDKVYGADGPAWGTHLTEIEDLFLNIGEVLSEKMLEHALNRQASTHDQAPETYSTCPSCHERIACGETNPRIVQTRTGEAQWQEPEGYCRKCRRSFFPSVPKLGDGSQ